MAWASGQTAGCDDTKVILTVRVATWELEEDGRVLRVGDDLPSWLTFHAADATSTSAQDVQVILGSARPLPSWPGEGLLVHLVQIALAG